VKPEPTTIAPAELLAQLLAKRLPRGNCCGICIWWESEDGEEGECAQGVPERAMRDGCGARDGCYEWFSRKPAPAWYDADYEEGTTP
jgi:hypothetical protein